MMVFSKHFSFLIKKKKKLNKKECLRNKDGRRFGKCGTWLILLFYLIVTIIVGVLCGYARLVEGMQHSPENRLSIVSGNEGKHVQFAPGTNLEEKNVAGGSSVIKPYLRWLIPGRDFTENALPVNRWWILIAYTFMIFVAGPFCWGWASLLSIYKRANSLTDYACSSTVQATTTMSSFGTSPLSTNLTTSSSVVPEGCPEREVFYSLLYNVALASQFAFALLPLFISGVLNMPKPRAVIALIMASIGWVTIGAGHEYAALMFIGHVLVGGMCELMYGSLLHASALFKGIMNRFVPYCIGASRSLALLVPLAIDYFYKLVDPKWFRLIFIGSMAVLHAIAFILTYYLVPVRYFGTASSETSTQVENGSVPTQDTEGNGQSDANAHPKEVVPLRDVGAAILEKGYIVASLSTAINLVKSQYIALMAVTKMILDDGTDLTQIFIILNSVSAVFALLAGVFSMCVSPGVIGLATGLCGTGAIIALFFHNYVGMVTTAALYGVFLSSILASFYDYNLTRYRSRPELANIISGAGIAFGGLLAFVATPISSRAKESDDTFLQMNYLMTGLSGLQLIGQLYMLYDSRKAGKENAVEENFQGVKTEVTRFR